jgi:endonuclease YncB( thermonuclease family)
MRVSCQYIARQVCLALQQCSSPPSEHLIRKGDGRLGRSRERCDWYNSMGCHCLVVDLCSRCFIVRGSAGGQVSVSFAKWQRAERLKVGASLRGLMRGRARTPPRAHPLRHLLTRPFALLGCAALVGVVLGGAVNWLETYRPEQLRGQTISRVEEPSAVRGTAALHASSGVTVIDGDTLSLRGQRIRLHGIDAPEISQTCADGWAAGRVAATRLSSLTSGREVQCQAKDRDRYGRVVAICRVSGQDLGAILVTEGLAWAFTRYSSDYVSEQAKAVAQRGGVHGHNCMPAWEWRAVRR